ncbi:MAG: cytochrome o ubiquinol oxidase subunit III [Verrucomicrobia bacterium]|nr:cytochrome o ubiquinol oxidase subunit III [Verrucomicrobiota bacterium]
MNKPITVEHERFPDSHHGVYSKTVLGFWIYLLTDFVLFGTLFASYAVLRHGTFGGPAAHELFDLRDALDRTLVLILCSLTAGLAGASAHRRHKLRTLCFFGATFLLGLLFMVMQFEEFQKLFASGNGWQRSGFLSAYFTLLGTFMIHVVFGLLWILVLLIPVCFNGINGVEIRRLTCLRMFWQFLSIIWIFIFTFVYLLGDK